MSKDAIIAEQAREIAQFKHQLDQLLKLIYGKKSERFVTEALPDQLSIFEDEEPPAEPEPQKE